MASSLEESVTALRDGLREASRGLVDREVLVELVVLAAIAGEHLLVVGPPGTAKSEAVRRVARLLGGTYFEYLLGRFTEPSEIFGPVDLRSLREGRVTTETRGMLPEAHVAFLDEIFLGSTAILNSLLGVLNERVFVRGHTRLDVPLRVCVAASNGLPDDEALAALADRFLLRCFVAPVPDAELERLLEEGARPYAPSKVLGLETLDRVAAAAREVDLDPVRGRFAEAVRVLRREGITLSDRRIVKAQKLVAAAAALAGRTRASEADLWPIVFAVPREEAQATAREALVHLLGASENPALLGAAQSASESEAARAEALACAIEEALAAPPTDAPERLRWTLRLEGLGRQVDAGFAKERLPEKLAAARAALLRALDAERG